MSKFIFGVFLLGISIVACAAEIPTEEGRLAARIFLRGSTGPYRGRVVDAKTKYPITGAIVVAVWYRQIDALVQAATVFYDATEVVTDGQGNFTVDAPNTERRAPTNTQFPVFTIFKPGYTYFQGYFAPLNDFFNRKDKPLLGTVELEPIGHLSGREQAKKLPPDLRVQDVPGEKVPVFLKALSDYRKGL